MHEIPYEYTGPVTTTYPAFTVVLLPAAFAAVKLTLYVQAFAYVCVGCCSVEFALPSPNDQDHDVGEPVEVSVKETGLFSKRNVWKSIKKYQ
jgi:hypothetical protein